jgi:hypothetical protein
LYFFLVLEIDIFAIYSFCIKSTLFRDVVPCNLADMYEYFGGTHCLLFSENSKLTFVVGFYRNLFFCRNTRRLPSNKFIQLKSYEKSEVHSCQEGTQEALNGRLGGPRTSLGLSGVKINPSPMRGFETRTVQHLAFIVCRSCYPAIAPTLLKKRA